MNIHVEKTIMAMECQLCENFPNKSQNHRTIAKKKRFPIETWYTKSKTLTTDRLFQYSHYCLEFLRLSTVVLFPYCKIPGIFRWIQPIAYLPLQPFVCRNKEILLAPENKPVERNRLLFVHRNPNEDNTLPYLGLMAVESDKLVMKCLQSEGKAGFVSNLDEQGWL